MTRPSGPENPELFLQALQRRSFMAFMTRAWAHISGGRTPDQNWHIAAIAYALRRVQRGASKRLLINIPPRNGKSNIVSIIWVAWMLGHDPALNFVCVSYATDQLSGKLARDCLSIMQSDWYRKLFPRTVIKRHAALDFETTQNGGRLATSVGGTLTGRGGDIIILDDVIKPEDANSDTARKSVNDWFRSTLVSRLNDKNTGAIICVMQRLHQYDLPGLLLETGKYDHLCLPAIAAEDAAIPLLGGRVHYRKIGDVLHPAREPLEELEATRETMGSAGFAAQYQQDPVPAGGNAFKAAWFKFFDDPVDVTGGEMVQSWDTAIKTSEANDWSVCITALLRGRYLHILDVWRGRVEFPDLTRKAIQLAQLHRVQTLLIEDKASGQQLVQTLRSPTLRGVPLPLPRNPDADKYSRAIGVTSIVENGQVYLPREAHWLGDFQAEVLAFPNGRHDDQVDAFSQLLTWARDRWMEPEPMFGASILIQSDGSGGW